jgi:hypothetical protein
MKSKRLNRLTVSAVALALLVPVAYVSWRNGPPPPAATAGGPEGVSTSEQLRELLAGRGLPLHLTTLRWGGGPSFLHRGERTREPLEALLDRPAADGGWAGVLLVRVRGDLAPAAQPDDGEHSLAVGGLTLFGDAALLAEVRAALAG